MVELKKGHQGLRRRPIEYWVAFGLMAGFLWLLCGLRWLLALIVLLLVVAVPAAAYEQTQERGVNNGTYQPASVES
jgi:hypothetical protein